MDIDPTTIANAIIAIAGAGTVYGGGRLAYNKYQANREATAQAEAGFSNMATTGQASALVSNSQCQETRKGMADSIHELKDEVEKGADRQTKQLEKLSDSMGELKEAFAGQEARILKAVGHGIREHEGRYHGRRAITKTGS